MQQLSVETAKVQTNGASEAAAAVCNEVSFMSRPFVAWSH